MAGEYPRGFCELFEDFLGDNSAVLTETAASGGVSDVTTIHGGWWMQTMDDAGADATQIATERCWEVDEGHPLIFETRLYTDDMDKSCIWVGFNDDNALTAAIPYENEGDTIEVDGTDMVGWSMEGAQDPTWTAVGVQNSVNNTPVALTLADDCADDTIQTLRMELNPNSSGTVLYFVDGVLVSTQTSWFRSQIVYCASIASDSRSTVCYTFIDYIYVRAPRS